MYCACNRSLFFAIFNPCTSSKSPILKGECKGCHHGISGSPNCEGSRPERQLTSFVVAGYRIYIYNSVMHILYYIVIYTRDVTVYLFFLNPVIIRQSVG